MYLAYHPEGVTWWRRGRERGRLKTGELPGKRGKRQCSITTQPNGSTITAPILPAQLNYCVERPREISGIDIESWRSPGLVEGVGIRMNDEDENRFDEGGEKKKEKGIFFTRMNLTISGTKARYLIIFYKFERLIRWINRYYHPFNVRFSN